MDWNDENHMHNRAFVSRPADHNSSSLAFLYNYNYHHYHEKLEQQQLQQQTMIGHQDEVMLGALEKNDVMSFGNQIQRSKKRLTSDQLELLETSFQEEIKLDPDRKMKMAQELGLQPRQIAVWFQNRRARWKNKQLERLYDALKQEFDLVSREKQKLQEEVLALRTIVKEQVTMKQLSTGYTEMSGEETVESTSAAAIRSSNNNHPPPPPQTLVAHNQLVGECNYAYNVVNMPPPPYWSVLPPPYP